MAASQLVGQADMRAAVSRLCVGTGTDLPLYLIFLRLMLA